MNGARTLDKQLREAGWSTIAFARRLFVTPSMVSRWRRGLNKPHMKYRALIAREFPKAVWKW